MLVCFLERPRCWKVHRYIFRKEVSMLVEARGVV